jgi:hypothetical protein
MVCAHAQACPALELVPQLSELVCASPSREAKKSLSHPSQSAPRPRRGGEFPQPSEPVCAAPSGEVEKSLIHLSLSTPSPRARRRNPSATRASLCHAHRRDGEVPQPSEPCPGRGGGAVSRPSPRHALERGGESVNRLSLCPRRVVPSAHSAEPPSLVTSMPLSLGYLFTIDVNSMSRCIFTCSILFGVFFICYSPSVLNE